MRSGPHLPVSSSSSFLLQKRSSPSLPAPSQSPSSEQVWGSGRPPRPPCPLCPPCLPWVVRRTWYHHSVLPQNISFYPHQLTDNYIIILRNACCENQDWLRKKEFQQSSNKPECSVNWKGENISLELTITKLLQDSRNYQACRSRSCRPGARRRLCLPSVQHTGYPLCRPDHIKQDLVIFQLRHGHKAKAESLEDSSTSFHHFILHVNICT